MITLKETRRRFNTQKSVFKTSIKLDQSVWFLSMSHAFTIKNKNLFVIQEFYFLYKEVSAIKNRIFCHFNSDFTIRFESIDIPYSTLRS